MTKKLTFSGFEGYIAGVQSNIANVQGIIGHLDETMVINFEEHFQFQNLKTEAMLAGRIDEEVAQAIFMALGPNHSEYNGGWADGVDLATKFTVTKIIEEVLGLKLKNRLQVTF